MGQFGIYPCTQLIQALSLLFPLLSPAIAKVDGYALVSLRLSPVSVNLNFRRIYDTQFAYGSVKMQKQVDARTISHLEFRPDL